MNRAQLDALLAAGLITLAQHQDTLAARALYGDKARKPVIDMHLPATVALAEPDDEADPEAEGARTLTGTICVYEELVPSHMMILHTGSLEPRMPLTRVKMLRDHVHGDPVGYMTALDAGTLEADFYVPAGENGDKALTEAANGLRDGLSVGFSILEYEFDEEYVLHVHRAELYEVSLCAIPAVADAGITNVAAALATARKENHTMNRAQLAAALSAGTITQAQHDAALAALTAVEAATAGAPAPVAPVVPAEFAAGPQPVERAGLEIRDRGLSLQQVSERLAAAATGRDPMNAVRMALAEIVPADDAGHGFIGQPEWIGEVWKAEGPEGRPWIDSFGGPKPLNGTKIEGYQWGEEPVPEKYEGNLEEVPSNGFSTTPISTEPERWAWAARLDRIYRDLGSPDLVQALFARLRRNYDRVSDFDIATQVLAKAHIPKNGAVNIVDTSVLGAIGKTASYFRSIGATLDRIKMSEDLFDAWAELKIDDLPAWLALNLGLNLTEGKTTVGELLIEVDTKLPAGKLASYDKRAVTVYEKSPIELEALVIPNGGLDIGFFSYGGLMVNDARAIELRTVDLP